MGQKITYTDDVLNTDLDDGVMLRKKFAYDGVEVELEVGPETDEAFTRFVELTDNRGSVLRELFAPDARKVRSKAEMDAIRKAAREAVNEDGSAMFEKINDTGRLPNVVYTWYDNEYLPAQAAEAEQEQDTDPESDSDSEPEAPEAEAPTAPRQRRRS